jgi:hypothetical protein
MGTNLSISTPVSNGIYHTVPIRSELPTIPKDYNDQLPHQLPPENFWIDEVKRSNTDNVSEASYSTSTRNRTTQKAEYKLLYTKANRPCKYFCFIDFRRQKNAI